jgi:hypothetical protein
MELVTIAEMLLIAILVLIVWFGHRDGLPFMIFAGGASLILVGLFMFSFPLSIALVGIGLFYIIWGALNGV